MLVQLSPWDTTKTSIKRQAKTKRKRKRWKTAAARSPYRVSFVNRSSLRANQKKMRFLKGSQALGILPYLTITTSRRITVVGRSKKQQSYEESSVMQYAIRPGRILQNGNSVKDLPQVPAFLDGKNDRIFALQRGNTRLCCWHALNVGGPDSASALRSDLKHPALSISLLPMNSGVIYGSCSDGSIYVAYVVRRNSKETLAVEYLPGKPPRKSRPIGAVAKVVVRKRDVGGKKRKTSQPESRLSLIIYQIYFTDSSFVLVRHRVSCGGDPRKSLLLTSTHRTQRAHIFLPTTCRYKQNGWRIDSARLLVSSSGALAAKVTIAYALGKDRRPRNGNKVGLRQRQYCVSISLAKVKLVHNPVNLPPSTRQVALLKENLLVAGMKDKIILYDLRSGVAVNAMSVSTLIKDFPDEWMLCADSKLSLLAIIYSKDGCVHAALATPSLDAGERHLNASRLTLAYRMSSSLTRDEVKLVPNGMKSVALTFPSNSSISGIDMQQPIRNALTVLRRASKLVINSKTTFTGNILLKSYQSAANTLLHDVNCFRTCTDPRANTSHGIVPLIATTTRGRLKIWRQVQIRTASRRTRLAPIKIRSALRFKPRTATLPQLFVDGATSIVLSFPLFGTSLSGSNGCHFPDSKKNAIVILKRLMNTGKVSSRRHFDGVASRGHHYLSFLLRSLEHAAPKFNKYSPMEMIHTLLHRCSDVSERQLVVMLSYVLCRATPGDVAEFLARAKHVPMGHPGKLLARQYIGVCKKERKPSSRKQSDSRKATRVSSSLLLAGNAFLLQRILLYSHCNETILRIALADGISHREANLIAGLLSDLLSSRSAFEAAVPSNRFVRRSTAVYHWLSAVCDSFRDELNNSTTSNDTSRAQSLQHALVRAVAHCTAVMSLQDAFRPPREILQELARIRREEEEEARRKKQEEEEEDIPAYTIDDIFVYL